MPTRRCLVLLALLATAPSARAMPAEIDNGFLADLNAGVGIPLAEDNYKTLSNDVSFRTSLRIGWALQLHERFRVAPEVSFNFMPVNTTPITIGNTSIFRFGLVFGGRFIVPLHPRIAVFGRFAAGFDQGIYNYSAMILGTTISGHIDSTAFAFEPGLGAEATIIRHLVAGITMDVPVAFHSYSGTKVTSIDFSVMAFVGYRMDGPIMKLIH